MTHVSMISVSSTPMKASSDAANTGRIDYQLDVVDAWLITPFAKVA
jgi:hypothetical protein